MPPRVFRFILFDRLRRLCRLKALKALTLPVPVILKRFLALDFVFSLGISLFLISIQSVVKIAPTSFHGFKRLRHALLAIAFGCI